MSLHLVVFAFLFTCPSANTKRCTSDSQCFPTGGVSDSYESSYCGANGECVCRGCFYLQEKSGMCALDASCSTSTYTSRQCEDDHRRSQVRAILWAVFLPCFGAANFVTTLRYPNWSYFDISSSALKNLQRGQ